MKKQFSKITILFIAILSVTACKKDDNSLTKSPKILLLKNDAGYLGVTTYTYDSENRMTTESFSGDSAGTILPFTYTLDNYDSKGRLTEFTFNYTGSNPEKTINSFNANGKLIRQIDYDLVTNAPKGYLTFEYLANKMIKKEYSSTNVLSRTSEYTLSANGKNFIENFSYNLTGTSSTTTTYSNFDDKKSVNTLYPYGYFSQPENENNFLKVVAINNITSAITRDETYVFEYNSDNYPTKRTNVATGRTIKYEYIKK